MKIIIRRSSSCVIWWACSSWAPGFSLRSFPVRLGSLFPVWFVAACCSSPKGLTPCCQLSPSSSFRKLCTPSPWSPARRIPPQPCFPRARWHWAKLGFLGRLLLWWVSRRLVGCWCWRMPIWLIPMRCCIFSWQIQGSFGNQLRYTIAHWEEMSLRLFFSSCSDSWYRVFSCCALVLWEWK